ncbi:MAG: DUF3352 domain-containing protein, partial [Candidatus Peregrinibacteria bacterium]
EWESALKTLSELNPTYSILLEGAIQAQLNRLFGANVKLRDDIYPLFNGEYALDLFVTEDNNLGIQLILGHKNEKQIKEKMEKLAEGFSLLAAQFTPKIKTVTLPDGTLSREMVADADNLKELRENVENVTVDCTESKETVYGFCYAVTNEVLILSNRLNGVKTVMDAKDVLANNPAFREALSNLSKVNEEMTFLDFQNARKLLDLTRFGALLNPYLQNLDAVTWVKHQFDDGVSTEGYVLIK